MNKPGLPDTLKSFLWITLGSVLYALGFDGLYVPNQIGFGGITSLGQIANFLLPALPIGAVVIAANIPLFLLGWRLLGGHLLISSLYAMAAASVLVDLFAYLFTFPPMDPMLASVFGGVITGLSLGIILGQGPPPGGRT